jgi:hypothetical protein
MQNQNKALIEAIKEAGRYTFFMAISVFVSVLSQKLANMPQNDTMIVVLTLALRIADKYLHESNKEKGYLGEIKPSGLLPF